MSKLLDYINLLDKNATARHAHASDTVSSMESFGLSKREQEAFLSGDRQRIVVACEISPEDFPVIHLPIFVGVYQPSGAAGF